MNRETKLSISDEIKKTLTEKKNYQNQLSSKIGVSAAHLINMKDEEKWDLVSAKMWNKAAVFFGKSNEWQAITTLNFEYVIECCKEAQSNSSMIAIVGNSGFGKTTALKTYARKHPNAFYVLTDYLQKTGDFLRAIAEVIGIDVTGNTRMLMQGITNRLNSLDSPLLILDDTGKLNDGNFRNIQLLYDLTEGEAGFIMAGTLSLKQYVDKMKLKGKAGFDELSRRVEYWQILKAPRFEEVKYICKLQGIIDEVCVSYIFNTAKNFGSVKSLITRAKNLNNEVTIETLELVKTN